MKRPYTKTPNEIIEAMNLMSDSEFKVTMALVRLTRGYHRQECKVSYDQLQEMTGLSRGGVSSGVSAAGARGFFERVGRSGWKIIVYQLDQNSLPDRLTDIDDSLPSRLEQSTSQTNPVYSVDQNTPILKKKENLKKEEPNETDSVLSLVSHFTSVSGIMPGRSNFADGWEEPLKLILNNAGNEEKAKDLLTRAVQFARNGNGKSYTIKNPMSLTTIIANMPVEDNTGSIKVRTR